MILDIRGTNGSGKSWVVHRLLSLFAPADVIKDDSWFRVLGYHCPNIDLGVLGSYETECGGCDSIKTAQQIEERLREFAAKYHRVILEGITVSHTFSRYARIADDYGRESYKFMFLTTPVEVCIERVRSRRMAKGNYKPFNPDKKMGLRYDYNRVQVATKERLIENGYNVIDLHWRNPMPQVLKELDIA